MTGFLSPFGLMGILSQLKRNEQSACKESQIERGAQWRLSLTSKS